MAGIPEPRDEIQPLARFWDAYVRETIAGPPQVPNRQWNSLSPRFSQWIPSLLAFSLIEIGGVIS